MTNINLLEEGNGLGFTTVIDGDVQQFRLVIIARKNWATNDWDNYSWGYINQTNKLFTTNCYTGGNTGFGVTTSNLTKITPEWHKQNVLFSDDYEEMKSIAWDLELKRRRERANDIKQKELRVSKINELPSKFKIGLTGLDKDWQFVRTKAEYICTKSSSILGAHVFLESKRKQNNDFKKTIYLDNYTSRDNKMLVKKFANDIKWLFGNSAKNYDTKQLLTVLLLKQKEINNLIKDTK